MMRTTKEDRMADDMRTTKEDRTAFDRGLSNVAFRAYRRDENHERRSHGLGSMSEMHEKQTNLDRKTKAAYLKRPVQMLNLDFEL